MDNRDVNINKFQPQDLTQAKNGMSESFKNTQNTISDIQVKIKNISEKNNGLLSRITMSPQDKEIIRQKKQHEIKIMQQYYNAQSDQAKDILESRVRGTREACNSVLLTVITGLKAMSAQSANHTIKTATERITSDMDSTISFLDEQFLKAEKYKSPHVRDAALRMAMSALNRVENSYNEFLDYIGKNNLLNR